MSLYKSIRPLIFKTDPESSHHFIGRVLSLPHRSGLIRKIVNLGFKSRPKPVEVAGITFPNPLGIAAGFDKNGVYYNGLAGIGVGFVEVGSVTLRPQEGNPRPRIARLPEDLAIINRMGLNNHGVEQVKKNLQKNPPKIPIGLSVAPNHGLTTEAMIADMITCVEIIDRECDYISLNLSCPNQDGVTSLQEPETIEKFLEKLTTKKPVFCKFSVDISVEKLLACTQVLQGKAAGVILSNTSVKREGLKSENKDFRGGLSGKPLFETVLKQTKAIKKEYGSEFALIFCGGVFTPEDAQEAFDAGADLVQVYTGMIYEGPGIFKRILKRLRAV